MNKSFVWSKDFETGLKTVDSQHHHLIDLINQFAESVVNQTASATSAAKLFVELKDYTYYHFSEEELMMEAAGMYPEAIKHHKKIHGDFIEKVTLMKNQLNLGSVDDYEIVLDFLYQWLGHHILGEDQSMARQVNAIQSAINAKEAFETEQTNKEQDSIEPLLQALSRMLDMLTDKNAEMAQVNLHLEELVRERTSELEIANEKLTKISLSDVLTGLPNRRHSMHKLYELWQQNITEQQPLSCMMIDADHVKEVNDSYGHDAGDIVLCEISKTLAHSVRNDDFVARLGGDEFFIICPNTNLQDCLYLADKVLQRVKALSVQTGDGAWQGSVSIGVAEKTANMQTPEDLMKCSDESVYKAKDAGKDCVQSIQIKRTML